MIAYAAIDLRGGRAVQLVGGDVAAERVSRPDAVALARDWAAAGVRALHVVDLDAALGHGANHGCVRRIISAVDVPVQVGGGVRDEPRAAELLAAGAARVIAGTRAVEDVAWRRRLADRFPGRIVVAADVRDRSVVSRGWTHDTGMAVEDLLRALSEEPLAGVLVTDVAQEGTLRGIDAARFERLVGASTHPLIAAGGIRDMQDLRTLATLGAAAAVVGMALYTDRIAPTDLAREFAS